MIISDFFSSSSSFIVMVIILSEGKETVEGVVFEEMGVSGKFVETLHFSDFYEVNWHSCGFPVNDILSE